MTLTLAGVVVVLAIVAVLVFGVFGTVYFGGTLLGQVPQAQTLLKTLLRRFRR